MEERLASKDKIIYFLSQNISNQNLSYNEKLSWLPEISVKINKASTTNSPVSTKSASCSASKDNVEPNNKKEDDLKGDIDLTDTVMENINQSNSSTNTAEDKFKKN